MQEPPKSAVLITNGSVLSSPDRPGLSITSNTAMASPYGGAGGPYITAPLLIEGRSILVLTVPFEFTPWFVGQTLVPAVTNVKVTWGGSVSGAYASIPGCAKVPVIADACTSTSCNFTCAVEQISTRETFTIRVQDGMGVDVPGLASMVTVSGWEPSSR